MKKSTASLLFILFTILAIFALLWLTSCKVNRHVSTSKVDSVAVKAIDSGKVVKQESKQEQANTWFKETFTTTMQPINNDTTINHYYTTTVVKEGGTSNSKQEAKFVDSSWLNSYDSLKVVLQSFDKKSEVKVLSFWQILGIFFGCSLFFFILNKIKF